MPETKQLEDRLPGMQASKLSLATNTTAAELVKEKIGSEEFLDAQQSVVIAMLEDPPGQVFYCGDLETVLASREKDFLESILGIEMGSRLTIRNRWRRLC